MATLPQYVPAGSGAPSPPSPGVLSSPNGAIVPTVPSAVGLGSVDASAAPPTFDPSIASKLLAGGSMVGAEPAQPARPYDEKQLVSELAGQLGVKATKGETLEARVIHALATKYGVKLTGADMTTQGTGTGQGSLGQARHSIASWFDQAVAAAPGLHLGGGDVNVPDEARANAPAIEHDIKILRDQANKIKDPKLRQQALAKIDRDTQGIEGLPNDLGTAPGTPKPVENTKALNDMLAGVAKKLGVDAAAIGQGGLTNIARGEHLATASAATAAVAGRQQTAGDAYQSFVKQLADPKTATATAAGVVPLLEQAGLLDRNSSLQAGATKQTNGTTFTNAQIAGAYQQVLTTAVKTNQTQDAALESMIKQGQAVGGSTSEMEAYVQGVATEFGVGLTTQQVTEIANTYGVNAGVADNPAAVADQIKDAVMSLYDPNNPNNPAGVADTMFTNIKQAALSYQIPISDQQIGNMVKQDLQGATVQSVYATADAAQSAAVKQFQEQAQGLYPALSAQIAAGQTVQNLVTPYFNVAEAITGVPAATMMADQRSGGLSKWAGFLQGGQNPAGTTKTAPGTSPTGSGAQAGPQMMTLDEWRKTLMKDPQYGFQNTQGGRDMAEQMSAAILNEFGKVNTLGSQPFNVYDPNAALAANRGGG